MRKAKSQNSSPLDQEKILKYKPLSSLYLTKVTSLNHHTMVLIYNDRIQSFADVEIQNDCSFIDLSLNKLTDFTDFPSSLSDLTALILDSNQIVSFNGMQSGSFPKLRFLSLKQNPISQNIYFKLMCLIVFGSQLCTINGEKVNDIQRQSAIKLRKLIFPHLIEGKIITNLDPLRFREASAENEKCKTTPYMKNIQIKTRGTYSSPIYSIKDTPKKAALNRRIIEMINDNNIVASPTNYLKCKKYILDNEIEEQKISPVKNSQRSREEEKNTNSQAKLKNNKKKFVEKNNQIIKERQKLAKKETDTNKEEQKTAKITDFNAEEKNDRKKIFVDNHDDDDKEKMINNEENDAFKQKEVDEKCHLESAISQAEKKNDENKQSCNEEQKMEIDENKIVSKEVNVTMKTIDRENMQINKNEPKLLDDKKEDEQAARDENDQEEARDEINQEEIKDENEQMEEEARDENDQMEEEINDENNQVVVEEEEENDDENNQVEEETNDENKQMEEEELNDENKQMEEEELNDDENNQVEEEELNDEYNQVEEEELNDDENDQMEEEEENDDEYNQVEEEEHPLNQSIIQDADKTDRETHNTKKVHFALEEPNPTLDPDDSRKLEIDKNLTVENEQEKEQDDSKFDIDHYYTYRAHNDNFKYTFGNISDPSIV